ncbi:hypothetical protein AMAG_01525 [Allomyces macrogynus ATCC 38327]|uniref:Uncharacterized protein n=1 Tax=Allomyces macrogynus (strain ATCC 38327) TaxID=578462 RepID=A0A0L0RZZ5_ALLM3|nr:hypothetical protein AMAG_01525 [Allomyces macrogynus ATCC 38327]|eukprot:KNE55639.1 hypothetical protein AMAG_01525 [Allomyces macrogynus ATCC 38327]
MSNSALLLPSSDLFLDAVPSSPWHVDWHRALDVAVVTALAMHLAAAIMLGVALRQCIRGYWRSHAVFWIASMMGVILLVPAPLCEVMLALAKLSGGTWWRPIPFFAMLGDLCVRMGYATVTCCRIFRVMVVSKRRTRNRFLLASGAIWLAQVVSMGFTTHAHIHEAEVNADSADMAISDPYLIMVRRDERIVTAVVFVATYFVNLLTDFLLYRVIVQNFPDSAPVWHRVQIYLPYIPLLATTVAYMAALLTSFANPSSMAAAFLVVTFNRFTPAIEGWIFYLFLIPQTRKLIKKVCSPRTSAESESAVPCDGKNCPYAPDHAHGPNAWAAAVKASIDIDKVPAPRASSLMAIDEVTGVPRPSRALSPGGPWRTLASSMGATGATRASSSDDWVSSLAGSPPVAIDPAGVDWGGGE